MPNKLPLYRSLYAQVLAAIALGIVVGLIWPETGAAMRPLGDGFIKLVRMLIGPIIFTTVVVGLAQMGEMREVGRIGLRAFVYFEVVSTLALIIGLVVVNVLQPGVGLNVTPSAADIEAAKSYGAAAGQHQSTAAFILNLIPTTVIDAFARGDILQILVVSILAGIALLMLGERVRALVAVLEQLGQLVFAMIGLIMRLAPIGAFGAMAFTVGRYGVGSLVSLGALMVGVYVTCALFVVLVLGGILRACGLSLIRFLRYIADEILLVLGHVVVGVGAAAADGEDGAAGMQQAGGRPRRSCRLLLQSRRHGHLHDDGGGVRGAGERRAPERTGAGVGAGDPDADVEGGGRGDRQRVRDPGGHSQRHPDDSDRPRWRCSSASIGSCRRSAPSPT